MKSNATLRCMPVKSPPVPPYGTGTLAEVMPQIAGLYREPLRVRAPGALTLFDVVGERRRVCLHLVDGLGWDSIAGRSDRCPTLSSLADHPASKRIRTGLPSTTVTSLASIGTGLPPGGHGLVGYTMYMRSVAAVMNAILFTRHGDSRGGSMVDLVVPETLQPNNTQFQVLQEAGVPTFTVGDEAYDGSPLTRAALRGTAYVASKGPEDAADRIRELFDCSGDAFVFSYDARLDRVGHIAGVDSEEFDATLEQADSLVTSLVERLPRDACLVVVGDHGMLNVPEDARIDLRDEGTLTEDVVAVSGEPRFRHLHTAAGAAEQVLEAWRDRLQDTAWVRLGRDAINEGWFGPVTSATRPRIGDVVVAFDAPGGAFQSDVDPLASRLVGHHGSFSAVESEVPFLVHTT